MQSDIAIATPSEAETRIESRPKLLPSRLPSLDGWRALSILLVLGEHSTFTWDIPRKAEAFLNSYSDADLGVRFFFVISGFLITYLLLKEHTETGKISLRNFYARRALRILPVYYAYLGVVFALQLLTPFRQPSLSWVANLTFTTNFLPRNWTTGHLWSLAVEEQFYLLWPLLLVLAQPQNRRRIFSILSIPIILAPVCRLISNGKVPAMWAPYFQSCSFFYNFDSLAIGCLAAVLFVYDRDTLAALANRFKRSGLILGILLVIGSEVVFKSWISVYLGIYLNESPVADTLQALGFGLLLLQSILVPEMFKALNLKIVAKIGVLSYSLYVWQMLFSNNPARWGLYYPWFMSFRYWLIPVFLTAICSYFFIEKPFMALRRRFRSREAKAAETTSLAEVCG